MNFISNWWCRGYLAFIDSSVLTLRITYFEYPFLRMWRVQRLKSLVTCISITSHCQQVDVTMSHPRNLKRQQNQSTLNNKSLNKFQIIKITFYFICHKITSTTKYFSHAINNSFYNQH